MTASQQARKAREKEASKEGSKEEKVWKEERKKGRQATVDQYLKTVGVCKKASKQARNQQVNQEVSD